MSTVNQLSHSVRRATASASKSFARSHEQDDADTREYQRLIASLKRSGIGWSLRRAPRSCPSAT